MQAPHVSGCGRWSMVDRVHGPGKDGAPRGADVAPTRRPRGSHVGGRTGGPDLPKGRSDGGGGSRPARAGTAQAGPATMAHGGATRMRRWCGTATGGDRPAAESGGAGG
uniref:Uncharacterized protein n=1 Tax=Oryza sativa subsp. japonica TaxID=39947 RepID=Q8H8G1_ORYSJ|nr:hypothetical protein [Oryza sativa Japonica Group]